MKDSIVSAAFLRFAAICALVTAFTTLAIHLMPELWAGANTFELQLSLRENPFYIARLWIVMVHCWLVVVSMLAVGLVLFRRKPHLAILGFIGFLFFSFTELLRTSLVIFAFNRSWRAAYAAAETEAVREAARSAITSFLGVNDALFFVFITAFHIGVLCYGLALLGLPKWDRRLGIVYLLWVLLGLPGILAEILASPSPGALTAWVGPYFQPFARALTAAWLWQKSSVSTIPQENQNPV